MENEPELSHIPPALLVVLQNLDLLIQLKDSQCDQTAVEVLMWARAELLKAITDEDYEQLQTKDPDTE
jgi:hypothetical protein